MAKKDTKLENLSKTVHMLIEEIRLSQTEGLDRIFMDVYSQQADMMTDSRQQGKVKHAFRDILGIVFFGVLAGNDEWEDIYDFAVDERETLRNYLDLKNGIHPMIRCRGSLPSSGQMNCRECSKRSWFR